MENFIKTYYNFIFAAFVFVLVLAALIIAYRLFVVKARKYRRIDNSMVLKLWELCQRMDETLERFELYELKRAEAAKKAADEEVDAVELWQARGAEKSRSAKRAPRVKSETVVESPVSVRDLILQMQAEGVSAEDIARQLDITYSEVELALRY